MNRTQEISRGTSIYKDKCCRVSYGVICRELYDEHKHRGEPVSEDPLDKKLWAENQIDWLIKQVRALVCVATCLTVGKGETISEEAICVPYKLKIPIGKERETYKAHIVMSTMHPEDLPASLRHDGVSKVCQVEAKIDVKNMKVKKRHTIGKTSQWYLADFDIRVLVGFADLKFQISSRDGRNVYSREHTEIEVDWLPADSNSSPAEDMGQMWRSATVRR